MQITPAQWRMARAALEWTVREVASLAEIDKNWIVRLEAGRTKKHSLKPLLQRVYENGGIEFGEDGWVRLATDPPPVPTA